METLLGDHYPRTSSTGSSQTYYTLASAVQLSYPATSPPWHPETSQANSGSVYSAPPCSEPRTANYYGEDVRALPVPRRTGVSILESASRALDVHFDRIQRRLSGPLAPSPGVFAGPSTYKDAVPSRRTTFRFVISSNRLMALHVSVFRSRLAGNISLSSSHTVI